MANLTADDVTVTVGLGDNDRMVFGNKVIFANIAYGDGIDDYPAGGIPLPSIGHFDLYHAIRYAPAVVVIATGLLYTVDITNHKLYIWDLAGGAEYAGAPAATSVELMIVGQ